MRDKLKEEEEKKEEEKERKKEQNFVRSLIKFQNLCGREIKMTMKKQKKERKKEEEEKEEKESNIVSCFVYKSDAAMLKYERRFIRIFNSSLFVYYKNEMASKCEGIKQRKKEDFINVF